MKDTKIQLSFGLNANNTLVYISEAEKGGSYKCLSCGTTLIAKKGPKRAHHFGHYTIANCNGEGIIHKASKQIILEKMQITLPNGDCKHFDSARDEAQLDEMRPDVLALIGDSQLIIEVYCTNKIDDDKKEKIKTRNISAIEINLSGFKSEKIQNKDSLWLYINNPDHVTWLHKASTQEKIKPFTSEEIEQLRKFKEIVQAVKMSKTHKLRHALCADNSLPGFNKLLQQPIVYRKPKRRF